MYTLADVLDRLDEMDIDPEELTITKRMYQFLVGLGKAVRANDNDWDD